MNRSVRCRNDIRAIVRATGWKTARARAWYKRRVKDRAGITRKEIVKRAQSEIVRLNGVIEALGQRTYYLDSKSKLSESVLLAGLRVECYGIVKRLEQNGFDFKGKILTEETIKSWFLDLPADMRKDPVRDELKRMIEMFKQYTYKYFDPPDHGLWALWPQAYGWYRPVDLIEWTFRKAFGVYLPYVTVEIKD